MLERDGRVVGDRREQRAVLVGERRVAVADELADLAALPAQRQPHRVLAGTALRPRDVPVLEHERRAGRTHGLHRRLHDRLERLLEVERLGDRLRDPRQRLELVDPPLRLLVQLRVLDRLRDLVGDREQELDLVRPELARLPRTDVEGAGQLLAGQDRDGQDRLVLVLRQVREGLKRGSRSAPCGIMIGAALGRGRAGDSLARPHARAPRQVLGARPVRRAEDELVAALVVEVDEAGVGAERVGDLGRDQVEHLLRGRASS